MATPVVLYERRDGIAYITLNRPEVLNALNDELLLALREAMWELDSDDDALIGILSGNGTSFCSGADIKQRQMRPKEELAKLGSPEGRGARIDEVLQGMSRWKPVIAAVHGFTVGGGLHIALMCEMIVAEAGAKFFIPELKRGLWVANFWHLLSHRAGSGFASDVCLTGREWDAEEGLRRGAVDRVAPAGERIRVAEELARVIMANPPLAVREAVEIRRGTMQKIELTSRLERHRALHLTEDFHESARAFAEKRPPVFRGR